MAAGGTEVIDKLQIELSADVSKASRSITGLIKKLIQLEATCNAMPATNAMLTKFAQLNKSFNDTNKSAKKFNGTVLNINKSLTQMKTHVPASSFAALNKRITAAGISARSAGKGFSTFTGSITGSIVKARALIAVVRRLWSTFSSSIEFASDLVEVQNVVDKAFANEAGKVEDLVQTSIQQFGMSELSAKTIASRYQAMGVALGITSGAVKNASQRIGELNESYDSNADSMADMSLNLTRLAGDIASFYNVEVEEAAEALNSVFTGQTRALTLAA